MKTQNIYWPTYQNIEKEVEKLLYYIHLDDNQLNVYSTKIAELILRICIDIESISKELYINLKDSVQNESFLNFDKAIQFLNKLWKIEEKSIIISSYNCYLSTKKINPFKVKEKRTGTERLTFKWNNAYQNIKHNRYQSIEYGNIDNLFLALGALFILNIYYKNQSFYLGKDGNLTDFDLSLGSSIFSITFHKEESFNVEEKYQKRPDFDEYLYVVMPDSYHYNNFKSIQKKINQIRNELIFNFIQEKLNEGLEIDKINEIINIEFSNFTEAFKKFSVPAIEPFAYEFDQAIKNMTYSLILNKNDI